MKNKNQQQNYYIVASEAGVFTGIISSSNLFSMHHEPGTKISLLIKRKAFAITVEESLKSAVEMMARENLDVLPVVRQSDAKIMGILTYRDILSAYRNRSQEHMEGISISLKRRTLKMLLHGKKRLAVLKNRDE